MGQGRWISSSISQQTFSTKYSSSQTPLAHTFPSGQLHRYWPPPSSHRTKWPQLSRSFWYAGTSKASVTVLCKYWQVHAVLTNHKIKWPHFRLRNTYALVPMCAYVLCRRRYGHFFMTRPSKTETTVVDIKWWLICNTWLGSIRLLCLLRSLRRIHRGDGPSEFEKSKVFQSYSLNFLRFSKLYGI